ncbi:MAG: ABC transporter ATP-binding protein, partial [Scardovia wiggsiae]|nr:ABC transporter ATP-binding protein [Scardovia wiggsiae]
VEVIATPQGDMFVTHNSSLEPPSRTRHDLHTSSDAARFHTGKPCSGEKTEKDGTHD